MQGLRHGSLSAYSARYAEFFVFQDHQNTTVCTATVVKFVVRNVLGMTSNQVASINGFFF